MTRTVVVTGASGFVGRALVTRIQELGWNVRPVSRQAPWYVDGWMCMDNLADEVMNETIWDTVFSQQNGIVPDVVHLAARAHVLDDSSQDPLLEFRRANVEVALSVAKAAFRRGVRRFVFVSSIGAVSDRSEPGEPLSEHSPCLPQSDYGLSKLEAEISLSKLALAYDAELVIVRPPLVFGKGAPGNLAKLARWMSRGIPLPLNAVDNQRSLIHVQNLCSALLCCVTHQRAPGRIFHVRDPHDYSTPEILHLAARSQSCEARLFTVPTSMLGMVAKTFGQSQIFERLCGTLQVDDSLIRHELGFVPAIYPFEL